MVLNFRFMKVDLCNLQSYFLKVSQLDNHTSVYTHGDYMSVITFSTGYARNVAHPRGRGYR